MKVPNSLPDNSTGLGVNSGQLYYLIKEIKQASDTTPEETLKEILLKKLLGRGEVHIKRYRGKDYFCASQKAWVKAGIRPEKQTSKK